MRDRRATRIAAYLAMSAAAVLTLGAGPAPLTAQVQAKKPAGPAATSARPRPPAPRRPTHVIIISEDGLRPDVLSHRLTPRHMQLMREGTTARRAETIPQSDTLPSHASMLSGVGAAKHGLWWNSYRATRGFIRVPTIFSVARAHGLSTAMIVGKPKLKHIALPESVDHFERPSYLCGGVSRRAAEYFTSAKPNLFFVHFSDPDEAGHAHGWMSREYLRAVRHADACLATLLEAVDRSGLASSTLIIVTADHGGHAKRHSGGRTVVDRSIPWIVRGPGVAPGGVIHEPMVTVDTAATALAALRLPSLPGMLGSSRFRFGR